MIRCKAEPAVAPSKAVVAWSFGSDGAGVKESRMCPGGAGRASPGPGRRPPAGSSADPTCAKKEKPESGRGSTKRLKFDLLN